jgi:hypothetical protein
VAGARHESLVRTRDWLCQSHLCNSCSFAIHVLDSDLILRISSRDSGLKRIAGERSHRVI